MACRPFMCDHDPACPDLLCPGRPVTLHRVPGFYDHDGGHEFNGGVTFPIPPAEAPNEPILTPEEAEGWTKPALWGVGFFAIACLIAAVFYGVQLQFPFD